MSTARPIVKHRKVLKLGGSRVITIPPEWFEAHGLDPDDLELLMVADMDIRIINPCNEGGVYDDVTKTVKGTGT